MTSHVSKKLKPHSDRLSIALDPIALSLDAISLLTLLLVAVVGLITHRAFRQSKQAVVEAGSLISVIVDALTSRIQRSETSLASLRLDMANVNRREETLEGEQVALHGSYEELMHRMEEVLANDRKVIAEFQQIKSKLGEVKQERSTVEGLPKRENFANAISEGDLLAMLTPTERQTLEILKVEGAKAAPELGSRLNKSREHTSRLMKKLYMEGYVNRDSNRAPFRYKLNDAVRSALESRDSQDGTAGEALSL